VLSQKAWRPIDERFGPKSKIPICAPERLLCPIVSIAGKAKFDTATLLREYYPSIVFTFWALSVVKDEQPLNPSASIVKHVLGNVTDVKDVQF
jgi:hypothetical protein